MITTNYLIKIIVKRFQKIRDEITCIISATDERRHCACLKANTTGGQHMQMKLVIC